MRDAIKIMRQLIMKGSLNDRENSDLFLLAEDDNVRSALETFAEEWSFYLLRTPHNIYLIPLADNDMFSVRLRELREHTAYNARNTDAYLQCYIIMVILWMLFGSRNGKPQSASSLRIKDIVEKLDERFSFDNSAEDLENVQISFHKIAEKWKDCSILDEGRKNKTEIVRTACRFLEKNKLIEFRNDGDEVRPRQRLVDLMTCYYLNDKRVNEINTLFEKEENNASI